MKIILLLSILGFSYSLEERSFDSACLAGILSSHGLDVEQFDAALRKYGYSLAQFKQDVRPGMTIDDLGAILNSLGFDLAGLGRLLGNYGLTVQQVVSAVGACKQKRSFDSACLAGILSSHGLDVEQFDAALRKYGYSLAQFKQDVRPGMTIDDLGAILNSLGFDLAGLGRLLGNYGLTVQQVVSAVGACKQKRSFDSSCLGGILNSHGLDVDEFDALLRQYGYSIAEFREDVKPGMSIADLSAILNRLGFSLEDLGGLLARHGLTVQEVVSAVGACKQKRSFDSSCLAGILKANGMDVEQFDAALRQYGYSLAQFKQDVRPGMTIDDLSAVLQGLGFTLADLGGLLAKYGMTVQQVVFAVGACKQKRSFDSSCLAGILKANGMDVEQFDAALRQYGYSLAQFKQDVRPGMTIDDLSAVLQGLGFTLEDLGGLLAKYGMTVQQVVFAVGACKQKRSFDSNCLAGILRTHGMDVEQFDAALRTYGYSLAQFRQDVRPGMTINDLSAILNSLGFSLEQLGGLLSKYGLTVQQVVAAVSACKQ